MNALSARYYPTQARATGSSWMHGVGRIGAILSAFAGAEMMALNLPLKRLFDPRYPGSLTVAAWRRRASLRPVILPSLQLPPRLCAERHSGIWFPVQSADCTAFSS